MGKAAAKAIMKYFKDMDHLKEASVEQLTEVNDIGEVSALCIRNFFTDEEFEEFVAPYEKWCMTTSKDNGFNVLHICKSNIDFNRYKDLHPAIVNWGIYGNDFSLTKGAGLFSDSIILGGFPDRHGVLGHRDRGRNL